MIFNRNKKNREQFLKSFGEFKDEYFNFELIERYFDKKDNTNAFHILSDKTCNDLDLKELFKFIDRTNSKVGQQYLYNKLRAVPANSDDSIRNEKIIDLFLKNPEKRMTVQKLLKRLNTHNAYYISTLFQHPLLPRPNWFFIIRILSFTSLMSLFFIPFIPQILFLIFAVYLINTVIHFWNKRNFYQYSDSIPELKQLINIAQTLYLDENLKEVNSNLRESFKVIGKIKNRLSFFRVDAKFGGDFEIIISGIFELLKIIFLLEPILLFGVLERLDSMRKELDNIFSFVGETDSLFSIASLRKGVDVFCIPEIEDNSTSIVADGIYHPLIIDCVKNNISICERSILLTGSNMSGKTSFIRSIGINAVTGLTLNTCFARQFSMPRMRIFSAIRISDDLLNDKSYYFEEVLTIKEMIDKSAGEKTNLFLLDEIFKGTNTVERISAGKAVLSRLASGNNFVFVSTHDIELAELLTDEYDLYHFSEKVENKTVDFDYILKNGKLKTRNAIRILQINNYPEEIISEAIEISKDLDKT